MCVCAELLSVEIDGGIYAFTYVYEDDACVSSQKEKDLSVCFYLFIHTDRYR